MNCDYEPSRELDFNPKAPLPQQVYAFTGRLLKQYPEKFAVYNISGEKSVGAKARTCVITGDGRACMVEFNSHVGNEGLSESLYFFYGDEVVYHLNATHGDEAARHLSNFKEAIKLFDNDPETLAALQPLLDPFCQLDGELIEIDDHRAYTIINAAQMLELLVTAKTLELPELGDNAITLEQFNIMRQQAGQAHLLPKGLLSP